MAIAAGIGLLIMGAFAAGRFSVPSGDVELAQDGVVKSDTAVYRVALGAHLAAVATRAPGSGKRSR
ncbi:MAG: hypothetical protein QM813_00800 [Verrucomicrobiota bacterium]